MAKMTDEQITNLAQEALEQGVKFIKKAVGVDDSDGFSNTFFIDDSDLTLFRSYIVSELRRMQGPETLTGRFEVDLQAFLLDDVTDYLREHSIEAEMLNGPFSVAFRGSHKDLVRFYVDHYDPEYEDLVEFITTMKKI